jgi:hypothetical protein
MVDADETTVLGIGVFGNDKTLAQVAKDIYSSKTLQKDLQEQIALNERSAASGLLPAEKHEIELKLNTLDEESHKPSTPNITSNDIIYGRTPRSPLPFLGSIEWPDSQAIRLFEKAGLVECIQIKGQKEPALMFNSSGDKEISKLLSQHIKEARKNTDKTFEVYRKENLTIVKAPYEKLNEFMTGVSEDLSITSALHRIVTERLEIENRTFNATRTPDRDIQINIPNDRDMGRSMDLSMDRSTDRSMGRDINTSVDRDMNKDMDRDMGRNMDEHMDRDIDEDMDRYMDSDDDLELEY